MMSLIADGHSLYVLMTIYDNFMSHKGGVYRGRGGSAKGGHAMTSIGYGNEAGTKYWLLQNSWGAAGWGIDGYGKVLRGTNLEGIEHHAYWVKAWVTGGKRPECTDSQSTGLSYKGNQIPCSEAIGGKFENLCNHKQHGHIVKSFCQKTCESCLVVGTDAPQVRVCETKTGHRCGPQGNNGVCNANRCCSRHGWCTGLSANCRGEFSNNHGQICSMPPTRAAHAQHLPVGVTEKIVEAKNLEHHWWWETPDLYVEVLVGPSYSEFTRHDAYDSGAAVVTGTKHNEHHPKWDESLSLPDFQHGDTLWFTVWEEDALWNDKIGGPAWIVPDCKTESDQVVHLKPQGSLTVKIRCGVLK